jgi:CRP-like cAMP-binding protein
MGGKCFKETNVANSIQHSKEHEHSQGGNSSGGGKINSIYVNVKSKEVEPKSKKSNKSTSSNDITNLGQSLRKTKSLFHAITGPKCETQSNLSQEGELFKILKEKNTELTDVDMINNCLAKHFFMKGLEKSARLDIIKEMSLVELPENTVIFQQGDMGKYFYIIQSGEVTFNANKIIRLGESFGELALLHHAPRSGTCITNKDCIFWVLERKLFRKIIEHINKMNFEENKKFIQSIPILDLIEKDQKAILISNLLKEAYEEGDFIVKGFFSFNFLEGDKANCLYIVKEGEVNCVYRGSVIRTLVKGDHFGEKGLLLESTRAMDVVAKTKCICYSISIETLRAMVGDRYRDILYLNFIKMSFSISENLNSINLKILENIFDCFKAVNIGKGHNACSIGHNTLSKLIIVIEGNLINVIFILIH